MGEQRLSAKDVAERLDRVVESTNEAIEGIRSEQRAQSEAISSQLSQLLAAINNPVIRSNPLDFAPEQEGVAEFNDAGELERPRLMAVDSPEFTEKAEMLAFMNEMVEIDLLEVSDRDADQVFQVGVNGRQIVLRRGERKKIPRYFVEVLARARPVNYRNEEYVDGDGTRKVRYPSRRGVRYPFAVVGDTPRGKAWLRALQVA